MDDPVLSAVCDDASGTCLCECDVSGAGGSGGSGAVGGSSGSGGQAGSSGAGGGDACGVDTVCDPAFPSDCGTLCQDICGGFDNFDTAGCGDDNRCFCSCVEGVCTDPV